jgi:hypothetical protein
MADGPEDEARGTRGASSGEPLDGPGGEPGAGVGRGPAPEAPWLPATASRRQDSSDFSELGALLGDHFDASRLGGALGSATSGADRAGGGRREAATRPGAAAGGAASPVSGGATAAPRRSRPAAVRTPTVFPGGGLELAAAIALAWPQVVGEEGAVNSQPVRLRQGRLTVAASSTVWAQTLQFMEQTIAAGLNERLGSPPGAPVIERISFRHAGWQGRPPIASDHVEPAVPGDAPAAPRGAAAGQESLPGLAPDQEAALRSIEELGLEPQLAAKIIAAMKASFVRDQQNPVR